MQGAIVGHRHHVRVDAGGDEGHSCAGDRNDIDGLLGQLSQHALHREVGDDGLSELAQEGRQLPLTRHIEIPARWNVPTSARSRQVALAQ